MIPQLKSIFNKNQWVQIQNWVNGRLSLKTDKFDANNTASGVSVVTLNTTSGIVTFTGSVDIFTNNPFTGFTVNNNKITTNTKIFHSLSYDSQNDGMCQISSYVCFNGSVVFYLTNFTNESCDEPKIISFQILN